MAIRHTTRIQWTSPNGGLELAGVISESADAEQNRQLAIEAANDQEFDLDFLKDDLKSIFMLADQDMTIETNAADASGGQEISLVAGVPFWWAVSTGAANPITADVTKIYVTAAEAGTLDIRILFESAA